MDDQLVATRFEVAEILGLAPEDLDKLATGLLPSCEDGARPSFTFAELSSLRSLSSSEIQARLGSKTKGPGDIK